MDGKTKTKQDFIDGSTSEYSAFEQCYPRVLKVSTAAPSMRRMTLGPPMSTTSRGTSRAVDWCVHLPCPLRHDSDILAT